MSNKVSLLFSRRNMIGSWLIRAFTWSRFSHVEFVTDDITVIGANIPGGVQELDIRDRLNHCDEAWMIDIPCSKSVEVIEWARNQVGKKYDYFGLLNFIVRRDLSQSEKWFCSELVTGGFESCGVPLFRAGDVFRTTPQQIWQLPFEAKKIK